MTEHPRTDRTTRASRFVRFLAANKMYVIVPLVLAAILLLVILLAPSPDVVPPFQYQ